MSGPLNPLNHDVIISAATRLVRVCVRLYPRRFRAEYGSEMEGSFRGRMLRASTAGTAPLMWALLTAFQDVLTGAVAERFAARRSTRGDAIVARRRREIGVRVALGADRRRVISAIFRRPLTQVGLGVLAGIALIAFAGSIEIEMPGLTGELSFGQVAMIGGYGIVMLGVCLLACIVPTRRALSVEPTVALRLD